MLTSNIIKRITLVIMILVLSCNITTTQARRSRGSGSGRGRGSGSVRGTSATRQHASAHRARAQNRPAALNRRDGRSGRGHEHRHSDRFSRNRHRTTARVRGSLGILEPRIGRGRRSRSQIRGSLGILEPRTTRRHHIVTQNRRSSSRTHNSLRPSHRASRTVIRSSNNTLAINFGSRSFRANRRIANHTTRRHHRIAFEDRRVGNRGHRHELSFRNRHSRLSHRIIWPNYRYTVRYHHRRNRFSYRYVYPYYHRKYVFVSLGGYWPSYSYRRYYWYGYHPYNWYGYDPVPYEVGGDTYNYYTYNYYGEDGQIPPVDHTTFQDVREKMAQQSPVEPASETETDRIFAQAVEAFEAGNYPVAADRLEEALHLSPDDIILPFAYSQALLADQQYHKAAEVLRSALEKTSPEEQGVFYPRGLYPDEETLTEHIERLSKKAYRETYNTDLQLLLGYQLLGIGEIDDAIKHFDQAGFDAENAHAVSTLTDLAEKIKAGQAEDEKTDNDGTVDY